MGLLFTGIIYELFYTRWLNICIPQNAGDFSRIWELLSFDGGIIFVDCVRQLNQKPISAYKHGGEADRNRKPAISKLQQPGGLSRLRLHKLQPFIHNYVVEEQKHVAALLLQKLTYVYVILICAHECPSVRPWHSHTWTKKSLDGCLWNLVSMLCHGKTGQIRDFWCECYSTIWTPYPWLWMWILRLRTTGLIRDI
jgi:hypothetical protein